MIFAGSENTCRFFHARNEEEIAFPEKDTEDDDIESNVDNQMTWNAENVDTDRFLTAGKEK